MESTPANLARTVMLRMWPLAAVTVVVVGLSLAGLIPTWSGLIYLVGVPPLDIFADLRLLLVLAPSWPVFVLLLVVVMAIRVVILAHLMGGVNGPRIRFAFAFYGAAALPALISAQLSYMGYAVLYVRVFWVSIWITLLTFIVLAAAPWSGKEKLRSAIAEGLCSYRRLAILAGYLAVVAILGGVAEVQPGLIVGFVVLVAIATALVLTALPRVGARRSLLWPVPIAVVTVILFLASWGADRVLEDEPQPAGRVGSLMVMSGINSSSGDGAVYRLEPDSFGFSCDQMYYYSYAGPGDGVDHATGVCPIRTGALFQGHHTHQPMELLAQHLAEQVEGLPRPVTVIEHSHSAWVAWLAASTYPDVPIDHIIVLSAFRESGHGFVDAHTNAPGRISSDLLRIVAPIATQLGMDLAIDTPALDRMLGEPDGPAQIMQAPLADHIRSLSVVAATDLTLMPKGWRLEADVNACPVWNSHPTLPNSPAVAHEINRFLDGGEEESCRPVVASMLASASRPLGVPRHDQIAEVFPTQ